MTLVEIIVATAVFSLFVGLVSELIGSYRKAYDNLETAQPSLRSLAHGLESLKRELTSVQVIYAPTSRQLKAGFSPGTEQSGPLFYSYLAPSGETKMVTLSFEPKTQQVIRTELALPDDADAPLTPEKLLVVRRKPITQAKNFFLQAKNFGHHTLLVIRLDPVIDNRLPMQTQLRLPNAALAKGSH